MAFTEENLVLSRLFVVSVFVDSFALIKWVLLKSLICKANMSYSEYILDNSKQDFKRKLGFCYRKIGSMENGSIMYGTLLD